MTTIDFCELCGNDLDAHRLGCPAQHPAYQALLVEVAELRRQLAEANALLAVATALNIAPGDAVSLSNKERRNDEYGN